MWQADEREIGAGQNIKICPRRGERQQGNRAHQQKPIKNAFLK